MNHHSEHEILVRGLEPLQKRYPVDSVDTLFKIEGILTNYLMGCDTKVPSATILCIVDDIESEYIMYDSLFGFIRDVLIEIDFFENIRYTDVMYQF